MQRDLRYPARNYTGILSLVHDPDPGRPTAVILCQGISALTQYSVSGDYYDALSPPAGMLFGRELLVL